MPERTGRPCSVCTSPRRITVENAIRRGDTSAVIANTYGLGRKSVRTHAEKHMGEEATAPPKEPLTPDLAPDATPLEGARANRVAALSALRAGEAAGLPTLDLTRLRNAFTQAEKHYAEVLAASEKQTPIAELVGALIEALRPFPDATRAVVERLERFGLR